MSSRSRPNRRPTPPLCAEIGAEDGLDPKLFFNAPQQHRKPPRKTLQLCQQVAQTLNYLLSGELGDELLQMLQVDEVRPAPDASRLLVIVVPAVDHDRPVPPPEILAKLQAATALLRHEVARSIHRKRAPQLTFEYRARPAPEGGLA